MKHRWRGASRRWVGGALLAIGGGALLLGTASWAEGAVARARARSVWDDREARRAVAIARSSLDGPTREGPPAAGSPVARLVIPAIGLDEIVVEGVGTRELNAGPGHLPLTPLPGAAGNAAISAHRDRHFSRLGQLRAGDIVDTETESRRARWIVVSTRIVDADAPAIRPTATPTLTLTTCWPIRWFGPAPQRLIVTAKPAAAR